MRPMKAAGYAPLVVVPTETPKETIAQLKSAGYVVVACDNPEKVIVRMPHAQLEGGDMLMAALHGIVNCGYGVPMELFTKELYSRMRKHESNKCESEKE